MARRGRRYTSYWPPYVPVAEKRAKAARQAQKLMKKGMRIDPVEIEGRTITRSFWGNGWCEHLESFSDYSNRLPRGRSYVRNGSVCHLDVLPGRIDALVSGSSLYSVSISIKELPARAWKEIKNRCVGQIGSMLELLQGKLSDEVMRIVTDREKGLFPGPREITFRCSCPDWAVMCKHVAAVLYGVGNRLDNRPELLFLLRGVDPEELMGAGVALPAAVAEGEGGFLAEEDLGDIFGIELDACDPKPRSAESKRRATGKGGASALPAAPGKKARRPRPAARSARAKSSTKTPPRSASAPASVERPAPAAKLKQGRVPPPGKTPLRTPPPPALPRLRPSGQSVARLRRTLKMTPAEFAERLDVTTATVYRWESTTGRLKLKDRSLQALRILAALANK
ncbi:SWIM zinc finger family protein [Desulfatiglans anilini]|uniref:SWIM zinc finger family protein n=1 Tax=Desulfatiglans anilini TaxID=90728 RepID=UPI0003FC81CB|nr:SWIM zinc finger family protein [Desulfatiglans anilini]